MYSLNGTLILGGPLRGILDLNRRVWDNLAWGYDDRSEALEISSDLFATFIDELPERGKVLDLGCTRWRR